MIIVITSVVIVLIGCLVARRKPSKVANLLTDGMPTILHNSVCIMNETSISMTVPFPLRGRVDQVFQLPDDTCVLVDTKRRERYATYESDLVQLTAYALILAMNNYQVRAIAYVRCVTNHGVKYIPVELGTYHLIERLYLLYCERATD